MNREEEYRALEKELENLPESLETVVQRAAARKKNLQKKRRVFGIPAASLAACFAGFVLLVNLIPPFAYACGGVPLLRKLAKAVAWSPSLLAAVENEYVQPIDQSKTVNGITASIQYVIVDQKQVHIFFTLDGDYDNLSAEMPEFSPEQVCAVTGADYRQEPRTLLNFTLDYLEEDVPDELTMTFGVTTYDEGKETFEPAEDTSILDERTSNAPDILAEFTFRLKFDPDYTDKGETIPINRTIQLDGQTLTVTDAELYPTHFRLNVQGAPGNTAWLKGLDFYLENERGQRFTAAANGVTATGSLDNPAMVSFRLDSPYFSRSRHLTAYITGTRWLDNDMERVRVNLRNQTADRLPEGVELYSAEQKPDGWIVQFRMKDQQPHHIPFFTTYYDAQGNEYESNGVSLTTGTPYWEGDITDEVRVKALEKGGEGYQFVVLPLRGYFGDEVWLCPSYSHTAAEKTPVNVAVK